MYQRDPDTRPESPEPIVRPRRSVRLPSYLSDYEVTRYHPRLQSRDRADTSSPELSEDSDPPGAASLNIAATYHEHRPSPHHGQLIEWSSIREDEQQHKISSPHAELSSVVFQQLKKENDELRHFANEQMRLLEKRNEALEAQMKQLVASNQPSHHLTGMSSPIPQPRLHPPQRTKEARPVPLPRSKLFNKVSDGADDQVRHDFLSDLDQRLKRLEMTSQQTYSSPISPRQSSPQRPSHYSRTDDITGVNRHTEQRIPPSQESTYRGPAPTIPNFVKPDPREFSRLRIALENILPADATERFKFQILVDHLKLEEALLIADSYSNSLYPFSDTMEALNQQYGQPHQLALQRIAELMDAPNIISGDVKAFAH